MRIILLGTGPFAVPTLRALHASEHEVVCAVSRPPRGRRAQAAPVTIAAEEIGIQTWLPEKVNSDAAQAQLAGHQTDLLVVCDYGEILKSATLASSRLGGINLHGSLLPKYRGAAPVQWAVLQGETETGITVIQMTPGLDAGPCLGVKRETIDPDETAGQLEDRLAELGAALVLEVVDQLAAGSVTPLQQDGDRATKAPRLTKEHGVVDWTRSALQIKNQVRALQPWPRAFTEWQRPEGHPLRLILHRVSVAKPSAVDLGPGRVMVTDSALLVSTGDGCLSLDEIQPADKRPMSAADLLRGYPIQVGHRMT